MLSKKNWILLGAISSVLGSGVMSSAMARDVCISTAGTTCSAVTDDALPWVKELKADDDTEALINSKGAFDRICSKLGWGFDSSKEWYVRFDLDVGGSGKALFKNAPQLSYVSGEAARTFSGGNSTAGGGAGDHYVIFKVQASEESEVSPNDVVCLDFGTDQGGAIGVKATSGPLNVTYSIGEELSIKPDDALYTAKTPLLNFEPTYKFEKEQLVGYATADVESNFLKFIGDDSTGMIGKLVFEELKYDYDTGTDERPYINEGNSSVTQATVGALLKSDTELTISGDFTMVEDPVGEFTNSGPRVFFAENDDCSGATGPNASSVSEDKATFEGFTSALENPFLCISANGSNPIQKGEYSATFTPEANTGYEVGDAVTLDAIGNIDRNGTELYTPYLTGTEGYISRVFIMNNGTRDVDYSANVITDEGGKVSLGPGATGNIPAGTTKFISITDLNKVLPAAAQKIKAVTGEDVPYLIESFDGKTRGSAKFTFVGGNNDLQAVYQTVNLESLEVQSIILSRPGGGDGQ